MPEVVVQYRVADIVLPELRLLEVDLKRRYASSDFEYVLSINLDFEYLPESILNTADIKFVLKENRVLALTFSIGVVYQIKDFQQHVKFQENKKVESPDNLLISIFSTTIDTARGYFYSKYEGHNSLHGIIIPSFNPFDILNLIKAKNAQETSS